MNLSDLGWNEKLAQAYAPFKDTHTFPARVVKHHRDRYEVLGPRDSQDAVVSGSLRHSATDRADFPAVGDWVVASKEGDHGQTVITALLPRAGVFSRKVAGVTTEQQILAANVDVAFLVTGLDGNFNVRRIERYLALAWDSGAVPVILLNKRDLCPDYEARVEEVASVALGVDIVCLAAAANDGLDHVAAYMRPGQTAVLLGSSGVGKSTIANALLGTEHQRVSDVRDYDSKGRHTTTDRELIILPEGGMIIDTPGLREIQLWLEEDSLERTFGDIENVASNCRFRDCTHQHEPGCAVHAALESGDLDAGRFEAWRRMQRELKYLHRRQDIRARQEEQDKWKKITKSMRQRHSNRGPKGKRS